MRVTHLPRKAIFKLAFMLNPLISAQFLFGIYLNCTTQYKFVKMLFLRGTARYVIYNRFFKEFFQRQQRA